MESWKRGDSKIQEGEQRIRLECAPGQDRFEMQILDGAERPRYRLLVKVSEVDEEHCGQHGTIGWLVMLTLEGETLLHASNDPHQDYFGPSEFPGLFLARSEGQVGSADEFPGLYQPRMVQVEGFCITMKAESATYNPEAPSFLKAMTLKMGFENGRCTASNREDDSRR